MKLKGRSLVGVVGLAVVSVVSLVGAQGAAAFSTLPVANVQNGVPTYTGTDGKDYIQFDEWSGEAIFASSVGPIQTGAGCRPIAPPTGFRSAAACRGNTTTSYIDFGAGKDTLRQAPQSSGGGPNRFTAPVIVNGGPGADAIQGSDYGDWIAGGPGRDIIDGLQGSDVLDGGDGPDKVRGGSFFTDNSGPDDDLIKDTGTVRSEIVDDKIWGYRGNDTIDPGPGRDKVFGDDGRDTITTLDGSFDQVDCGFDFDIARIDNRSGNLPVVVDRAVGCESLSGR